MPELLEEQRETWGTRGGFVLAAVGSAVGLGNLWGFPYKLYSYGGGAFLIPYITAMFCIGIPMLILEFSLGHFTQRAAPDAFARTSKKHEFVGWWGIILGFVIITYYPVILAYCFSFMYFSIQGILNGGKIPWAGQGIEGVENAKNFFDTYLGYKDIVHLEGFRLNILWPLIIAWLAMYFCIFRGVKMVGKIVWLTVPIPWLMLLVLTVRGLTLPGSMKGLVYYLDPVWSELAKPSTWRFAFGQVFFSLSLAYGVMITYASFLHRKSDINNNAVIIGLADFSTSFIAGLAIFATLGGMAYVTAQAGNPVPVDKVVDAGPGITFVAFPYALAQLPGSAWWSLIFFFTLVTLGIDSAFSITESVLAGIVDKTGLKRKYVLPAISIVGLAFGLFYITNGGLNWLETIDAFINGTWGIALLGLAECLVLGWLYRIENLRTHANERSDWHLAGRFNHAIRIFIPIILGALFFWSLFDDLTPPDGFLIFFKQTGEPIWPNIIGTIVVAIAPIIAIITSLFKNPNRPETDITAPADTDTSPPKHILPGWIALLLTLASATLITNQFLNPAYFNAKPVTQNYPLILALTLAAAALTVATMIITKEDYTKTKISPPARIAGLLSTLNISAIIAIILIKLTTPTTPELHETTITITRPDTLTTISYIILSIVFLLIIVGLTWCFYKAITKPTEEDA